MKLKMKKFRIRFSGYAYVEAKDEEYAISLFEEG